MSCGYSARYQKHIVISNNIFSTLYSIFIVFACRSVGFFSPFLFRDFAIYVFMRMLALCCWLFDLDSWHWRTPPPPSGFGWIPLCASVAACGYSLLWQQHQHYNKKFSLVESQRTNSVEIEQRSWMYAFFGEN